MTRTATMRHERRTIVFGRRRIVELAAPKDPDDVLDYAADLTAHLIKLADTISSVTWSIDDGAGGSDLTVDSSSKTSYVATVWLSGGTAGVRYKVTAKVVTANATPRTFSRSFYLRVEDL